MIEESPMHEHSMIFDECYEEQYGEESTMPTEIVSLPVNLPDELQGMESVVAEEAKWLVINAYGTVTPDNYKIAVEGVIKLMKMRLSQERAYGRLAISEKK